MKKFRSKRGFTLTEMLIAVLLLGFVSAMAAVMTSSVLNSTSTMQEVAQAEILGSEALENLQRELRFATDIVVNEDGSAVKYKNGDTQSTLRCDGGHILLMTTVNGKDSENKLFAGTSYGNLKVTNLKFSYQKENKKIKIDISVSYGERVLWSGDVSVKPLIGVAGNFA